MLSSLVSNYFLLTYSAFHGKDLAVLMANFHFNIYITSDIVPNTSTVCFNQKNDQNQCKVFDLLQ